MPGDVTNPKVLKIVKDLAKKIERAGKYAGSIVENSEDLSRFLDYGIKYITYSVDCAMIKNSYEKICTDFRKFSKT